MEEDMAQASDRNPLNKAGAWYVDSACIACGLCAGLAPDNFRMSDDGSTAFVFKQPSGAQESEASAAAMTECPVGAIGNDG
jgi:ferredoxin